MTDRDKDGGMNLRLAYDPALETKIGSLFGMPTADIIAAISGVTAKQHSEDAPTLSIRAVSWYLNLYPTGNNLDVLIGDKRYAIYSPTQEQRETYQRFTQAAIPALEEVVSFQTPKSANPYVITSIPVEARLLSQLPLDLIPTDSTDLGSLEILKEAGKLLAKIQVNTNKLPQFNGLRTLVFTPFKPANFLQLTPPFSLENNTTLEQIGEQIRHDLSIQIPNQDVSEQLNAFFAGFKTTH